MVPNNTVLRRGLDPNGKGRFGDRDPQLAAMPPIAKLLWAIVVVISLTVYLDYKMLGFTEWAKRVSPQTIVHMFTKY